MLARMDGAKNESRVLLDECAQKIHASMEQKSRISDQVAEEPTDKTEIGSVRASL